MTEYDVYHGTENAFAVVDADTFDGDETAFGVARCEMLGVDGTLFLGIERAGADDASDAHDGARATMTLVQPDGSRAAMCGNGARCAARWVAERTGETTVTLETGAGPRRCTVDGETVTVEMGVPSFDPADVPVEADEPFVEAELDGYTVTALNAGVPHAVVFVDDVDSVDLAAMAPSIRHHDVFPEGANVNLAAENGDGLDQRTFERGVEGETMACGTGAVAVAAVAARLGHADAESVTVSPPGGELDIGFRANGTATLRGPTAFVERGEADAGTEAETDR